MPVRLRSATKYYRRGRLLATRAVQEARRERSNGQAAVARSVLLHQAAGAQLADTSMAAMLAEQDLDTAADALLSSVAFTTQVDRMVAMIDEARTDYEFDRLVRHLVTDAKSAAEDARIAITPAATGWVRHLVPPSCKRCAILAGRMYRWSDGFKRHPGCDCVHVPTGAGSRSDMVIDVDDLVRRGLVHGLSKAELEAYRDGADLAQIVNLSRRPAGLTESGTVLVRDGRLTPAAIRAQAGDDRGRRFELLAENGYLTGPASRRPASSGSGGRGNVPPDPPPVLAGSPEPGDDDREAWRQRQDALGITTNGQVLTPDEIRFVERFHGRHGRVKHWIEADPRRRKKTNDFRWDERDIEVEVKSPKARYRTIANAIRNDAPWKQYFIIDLGARVLTDSLRWQLEKYNERNPANQIAALWVLHSDGASFEPIDLR